jgi:hypothetical protein
VELLSKLAVPGAMELDPRSVFAAILFNIVARRVKNIPGNMSTKPSAQQEPRRDACRASREHVRSCREVPSSSNNNNNKHAYAGQTE